MRLLLVSLLALSACAAPPASGPTDPAPPAEIPPGGLTVEEAAALRGLGIPVLVPSDPGLLALDVFEASADETGASYRLRYRRPDGACAEVYGTTDGVGGPEVPLVSTEARIAALGRTVRVYQAADDPEATSAQVWGPGTVVADFIDLDGAVALVRSAAEDGCRPMPLADGVAFVEGLQLLAAGSDALGAFAPASDVLDGYTAGSSPEAVAEAIARRYEGEVDRVEVEVVSEQTYEAVALVTVLGLRDDAVRDERLRLTIGPVGETWELVGAARQVRCWPGRGHEGWSPEPCL